MNSFLKKVALFAFAVLICNFLYFFIIIKTDYNFIKRFESLNFNNPSYDVLVLGNSLAMDAIDAEMLTEQGFDSYNLSIGGASIKSNLVQLNEYLSTYNKKPKFVILGLGSYMNTFDNNNIHPIVDFTTKNKKYNLGDLPMLKFKWLFPELLKKIVSKKHRDAYLKKGQLRFSKQVSDNSLVDTSRSFPIDKYKSSKMIKLILETCSQHDIKLIIVELPGFKKVRHKKSFDRIKLDTVNNNGILLDYNSIKFGQKFNDKTDWIGNNHLNIHGARKLTKELILDLKEIETINNSQD